MTVVIISNSINKTELDCNIMYEVGSWDMGIFDVKLIAKLLLNDILLVS